MVRAMPASGPLLSAAGAASPSDGAGACTGRVGDASGTRRGRVGDVSGTCRGRVGDVSGTCRGRVSSRPSGGDDAEMQSRCSRDTR